VKTGHLSLRLDGEHEYQDEHLPITGQSVTDQ